MKHSHIAKALLTTLLIALPLYGQRYDSPSSYNRSTPASSAANAVDPAKAALGKRLFSDSRLSFDEWNSCANCHEPAHGFSESRPVSVGVLNRRGKRHTPTLLGRASGESQFWDGRAATLEEQVLQPISDPNEMGTTVEAVLQRLHQDPVYRNLTRDSLAEALASYVRTIRSENSNYDLFLWGWPGAISDLELEGLRLFQNKARCYLCHSGNRFTDEQFHNTGIAWRDGALQDEGRAAITGKTYHKGAFKTPTLRDVGRRGPYMHDGSLATLEDVINYYDRGGNQNPHLDENIVPLHLTDAEKKALLAFLRTGLAGSVRDGVAERLMQSANRPIDSR
ncbi:MAG TPA: cytochrome c peroxidase [Candidatus Angelobacter sp.]|jgi:cytochrome c peroxidase|nr:cytochrome c peroxidase [Candidatus Angelobacter sp.]